MTLHVGITGTRNGCNAAQLGQLSAILSDLFTGGAEFHHGDCVGVDEEGWALATFLGYRTVGHPPTKANYRAYCQSDEILDAKPYLVRNRDIVAAVERLIVVPKSSMRDSPHSGTWQTYRMALAAGIQTTIIQADRW